jgi:hypothetical protein
MPPEARVSRFLSHVSQRLRWQAAARAVSVALVVALVPFIFKRQFVLAAGVAVVVAMAHWWLTRRARQRIAEQVESRAPQCRNVLITAEALIDGRLSAKPEVLSIVLGDAARQADAIAPDTLWPWLRPGIALAMAATLWSIAVLVPIDRLATLVPGSVAASSMPAVEQVEIVVLPPAYSGSPATTVNNPERISVLAGSRARLSITSNADSVSVESESGSQSTIRVADGRFSVEVSVDNDGYLAIVPIAADGRAGARRLIGVTALLDRAPEVRITEPGKDLFLRAAATKLQVRVQAEDDLGLRSVRLAYTKVAGAGESFTFTEGEAAVTIARTNDRQWTATGVLPLHTMGLDVGDMVVYRGVVLDGRPGAKPIESDAFIVEIVSAADAMAEGFSIDERQDKYALSQQMVIIKTERLIAKAPAMSAEAVLDEAMNIAAEQRSVRAEIVFMMGGEFEDEEVEAAHEHEITEGRTANSGRADLGVATRAMSRAASQLTDVDLKTALATERTALAAMQRALSRRRFILRTLTQRGQIDETRRLQGRLAGLGRGDRVVDATTISGLVTAARAALLVVTEVSRQTTLTEGHASRLSAAAGGLLATDGRGAPIVDVASRLSVAAEAIVAGTPDAARRALADAAARLTAIASDQLSTAPATESDRSLARLRGALADALRAGGGR